MATNFLAIQGNIQSAFGQRVVGPLVISNTNASLGAVTDVVLASGDNDIVVPASSIACIIQPPSSNTEALTIRTNIDSTDTGLAISPSSPTLYSFPATIPTTIYINAAAATTGITEITFI